MFLEEKLKFSEVSEFLILRYMQNQKFGLSQVSRESVKPCFSM